MDSRPVTERKREAGPQQQEQPPPCPPGCPVCGGRLIEQRGKLDLRPMPDGLRDVLRGRARLKGSGSDRCNPLEANAVESVR